MCSAWFIMVTMQKLKSFILTKVLKQQKQTYPTILDEALGHVFPGEGFVRFHMHDMVKDIKQSKTQEIRSLFGDYTKSRNLIFHVRDNAWLAKYIKHNTEIQQIRCLPLKDIENYVENSSMFNAERREFEQFLVKSYILECLDVRGDDFYSCSMEKLLESGSENCDKLFRSRVVNAMNYLGVDQQSIEFALEMNASLWRKNVMNLAFANRYKDCGVTYSLGRQLYLSNEEVVDSNSVYYKYGHCKINEEYCLPRECLKKPLRVLYDNWICLREYEYYHNHKNVIDKLGTATRNMQIQHQDLKKITRLLHDYESKNSHEKS